jgi:hypothetical protein
VRVLVCGGTDFGKFVGDRGLLIEVLNALDGVTCVIEGGAEGADRFARVWAESRGIEVQTFKANWNAYGKAAGPIRNQHMIYEGKPHLVIAFSGGSGTADCVRRARTSEIEVREIDR